MQTGKKNVNKDIIIETTLNLIEEKGGIKDVNLREIAKRIGCAHTNLYNYFNSLDEIFWEALGRVLLKMIDYTNSTDLNRQTDPKEKFFEMISSIVDFSIDHPGWYRLIWLEAIGGKPSAEIEEILQKPSEGFTTEIMKGTNHELTKEAAALLGNIIHSYMHGELCKWINHRNSIYSKIELKVQILSNIKKIFEVRL